MSQLSPILRSTEDNGLAFWCPGCNQAHQIKHGLGRWTWNGHVDKPTFTPSVLVQGTKLVLDADGQWTGGWELDANGDTIPTVCHSYIVDGRIQFLGDCTHALAGQTHDLPAWSRT